MNNYDSVMYVMDDQTVEQSAITQLQELAKKQDRFILQLKGEINELRVQIRILRSPAHGRLA